MTVAQATSPIPVLFAGGKASGVDRGKMPEPEAVMSLVRDVNPCFEPQVVFLDQEVVTEDDRGKMFERIVHVLGGQKDAVVLHDASTVVASIQYLQQLLGVFRLQKRRIIFLASADLLSAPKSHVVQGLKLVPMILPHLAEGIYLIEDDSLDQPPDLELLHHYGWAELSLYKLPEGGQG